MRIVLQRAKSYPEAFDLFFSGERAPLPSPSPSPPPPLLHGDYRRPSKPAVLSPPLSPTRHVLSLSLASAVSAKHCFSWIFVLVSYS
jgi:hypothetical protein